MLRATEMRHRTHREPWAQLHPKCVVIIPRALSGASAHSPQIANRLREQGTAIFNISLNINILSGSGRIANESVNPSDINRDLEENLGIATVRVPKRLVIIGGQPLNIVYCFSGPAISRSSPKPPLSKLTTDKTEEKAAVALSRKSYALRPHVYIIYSAIHSFDQVSLVCDCGKMQYNGKKLIENLCGACRLGGRLAPPSHQLECSMSDCSIIIGIQTLRRSFCCAV